MTDVDVLDASGTFVKTVSGVSAVAWVDEWRGAGTGALEVRADHPDVGEFVAGRMVRCQFGGSDVFVWLLEDGAERRLDADAGAKVVRWEGPGALALLGWGSHDEAVVVGTAESGYRTFGWVADDWDETGWTSSVALGRISEGLYSWGQHPEDFPDRDAFWIMFAAPSASGSGVAHTANSSWWHRRTFTPAAALDDTPAVVYWSCDDTATVYWDGRVVGSVPKADSNTGAFRNVYRFQVTLGSAHTLAVELSNGGAAGKTNNPAGLVYSVVSVDPDTGDEGAVLWRSAGSLGVWTDTEPAGVTAGYVASRLIDDAQARGAMPAVSYSFDADLDSDGAAWATTLPLVSYRDGEQVGAAVKQMWQQFDVHTRMTPSLELLLTNESGDDLSASVQLEDGAAAREATVQRVAPGANVARIETDGGFGWSVNSGRVTSDGRRRETSASFGTALTVDEVVGAAETMLDEDLRGAVFQSVDTHEGASPEPYTAYVPGDTVGLREGGGFVGHLVSVLSVTGERNGQASVTVDTERRL